MSIKEMSHACCSGMSGKRRKIVILLGGIVFLAIVVFVIASVSWRIREARNFGSMMYGRGGEMINRGKQIPSDSGNQFILPQDALKSGELAIVVNDLESAKSAVADVAKKSDGNVYATFMSYASRGMKNGSIVVQVPAENFDMAFEDLKKVGQQVVQESTQQIAPVNYYPMPMSATTQSPAEDATVSVSEDAGDVAPEIAIYPALPQIQPAQNKGYVRVVFVDYGNKQITKKQAAAGSVIGVGNPANQNMRESLLVIIGIKLILLVAIFGLLLVIFKKIFHKIRKRKENKHASHIVRQMPKTRARIVKSAKIVKTLKKKKK